MLPEESTPEPPKGGRVADLYTRFDSVFFEKTRLSMMTIIYKEEKVSFNMLKERIGGSDGSIYTHLEKLVSAGYVEKRKEVAGTTVQTIYTLTEEGAELFRDYLRFLEELLQQKGGNR